MKNYLTEIIDLTGDSYLNPVPAVYDNGQHIRPLEAITSISVHHDADLRPHDYDSVVRYRQEAAGHFSRLGPGLQYHYVIDNTGQIFSVRPLTTWLYCVGSAENTSTLAIKLDGNFETQKPTREQFEALFQLLKHLCTERPDFPATWPDVRPHASFNATACCGSSLRGYIYAIKDETTALAYPDVPYDWPEEQPDYQQPAPAPTPAPQPTPPSVDTPPPPVPTTPPPSPAPDQTAHDFDARLSKLEKLVQTIFDYLMRWSRFRDFYNKRKG